MRAKGLYFDCRIDDYPADTFSVTEFTLDEALSELFTLTLTLTSAESDIDVTALILRQARLTVITDGAPVREVVGIITGAKQGKRGFRQSYYTLVVRPPLWLLTQRQQSRIFHFKTLPEVLNTLLQEHQIRYYCDCRDNHSQREFITQKRETDYEFFCRLAAEEGMTFWFEVNDGQIQCVYTDSFLSVQGGNVLEYNDHPQNNTVGDFASHISLAATMTPQAATGKDRTYLHPRYAYQHTAEQKTILSEEVSRYTIYDSYARFPDYDMAQSLTRYRLEALQNQSRYGEGRSNSFILRPGYYFKLGAHPNGALNQEWQVTSVRHHGVLPQSGEEDFSGKAATLTNEFTFIDYFKPWRPLFIPKPLADGPEVAEVVGPEGEEIFTNKLGQVKVHFHWNLHDNPDEKASCWVRVMQGWSGNGYGFYAVPRVGQEVIVSYLNGDIDRPIITGCTYNDIMELPVTLPENKTQTVFRTQTYKGKGNNELRFDDKSGKERVFIQSQKDFDQLTLNDHTVHVKHNSHLQVDKEHSETIKKNRYTHNKKQEHHRVDSDRKTLILKNDYKTVAKSEHTTVGTIKTLEAGIEINLKAEMEQVIDGGFSLTLKAGGQHIILNPAGIWMSTPAQLGGAPMTGTLAAPLLPMDKIKTVKATSLPSIIHKLLQGKPIVKLCPKKQGNSLMACPLVNCPCRAKG